MTRFESILTVVAFLFVMASVLMLMSIYGKMIMGPLARLPATKSGRISRKPPADSDLDLTDQEREVLKLVADGMATREIAQEMQLPQREVEAILRALFDKLPKRE